MRSREHAFTLACLLSLARPGGAALPEPAGAAPPAVPAGLPVEERVVGKYLKATTPAAPAPAPARGTPYGDDDDQRPRPAAPSRAAKEAEAVALFQQAPRELFVFARQDEPPPGGAGAAPPMRRIRRGEALLVTGARKGPGRTTVSVLTVDGRGFESEPEQLGTAPAPGARPLPLAPGDLIVRDASGRPFEAATPAGGNIDWTPAFLGLIPDGDPRKDRFFAERDRAIKCYEAEMAKLDPSNRRARYDIVKGDRVQSLSNHYDKQVSGRCGLAGFYERRAKLSQEALAPLQREAYDRLRPAIDRVNGLFAR